MPVSESIFNKVAGPPVKFCEIFKKYLFLKKTSGGCFECYKIHLNFKLQTTQSHVFNKQEFERLWLVNKFAISLLPIVSFSFAIV